MEFGEKLKELRKRVNMTQDELANKLYVTRSTVSKWESGNGYPSIDTLKEISNFFDVSIDDLLSNSELIELSKDNIKKEKNAVINLSWGAMDIFTFALLLFVPMYGFYNGKEYISLPLFKLGTEEIWVLITYYILIIITMVSFFVYYGFVKFGKLKISKIALILNIGLSVLSLLIFLISKQPYAGCVCLFNLLGKGTLFCIKEKKN